MTHRAVNRIAAIVISAGVLLFTAGSPGATSDDIARAALEMKKAAEAADRLEPNGEQVCNWAAPVATSSDMEQAIARYLVAPSSSIPENIRASRLWRVSLVASDITNRLRVRVSECATILRYEGNTRSTYVKASEALAALESAQEKFDNLAFEKTLQQEEVTASNQRAAEAGGQPPRIIGGVASDALTAAEETKRAAEFAGNVTDQAAANGGCTKFTVGAKRSGSLPNLSALIDGLTHKSQPPSHALGVEMWLATRDAKAEQIRVFMAMEACAVDVGEKKGSRNLAAKSLEAYSRLTKATAALQLLALRETELEEQAVVTAEER